MCQVPFQALDIHLLILITTQYYLPFTDEKIEVQRSKVACLRPSSLANSKAEI